MTRPRVVGLGLGMVDLRVRCAGFPEPERDTRVGGVEVRLGGSTAAVLAGLARLGWPTELVGAVGGDRLADAVHDGLAAAGVGSAGLRRLPGVATPTCLVLDAPPTRTLLWHVAPEVEAALDDLDWSGLDGAGALHVNGRYATAALRASRQARRTGVLVSLNAGRGDVAAGAAELLPYADLAVVSDEWALARTGAAGVEAACVALLDLGPALVSVTCGAEGSVTAGPGTAPVRIPAVWPPAVRTTVGAGDAYHAAFLAAHLSGVGAGDLRPAGRGGRRRALRRRAGAVLRLTRLDAPFGAVLARRPTAADAAELRAALYEHQLLVLPGPVLSPADQLAVTALLGRPEAPWDGTHAHPGEPRLEVFHASPQRPYRRPAEHWHTDGSFLPEPTCATLLHALVVPARGGRTRWADARGAYAALPAAKATRWFRDYSADPVGTVRDGEVDLLALCLLVLGDRLMTVRGTLLPLLRAGRTVLVDRYLFTPLGEVLLHAGGAPVRAALAPLLTAFPRPDLAVADAAAERAMRRVAGRPGEADDPLDVEVYRARVAAFRALARSNGGLLLETGAGLPAALRLLAPRLDGLAAPAGAGRRTAAG